MTNITGKIYQMKNADGTENRFPRTVIEAVLGLSSYLQDQFSSLADIYMPIEGIYEALTGQEFVFRKSPNTIKAKSLTIDRIKGKTIAWNQLVSASATSVVVPSSQKYLSVIGGTKAIATSDGTAITVTGGVDMVFDLTLMFGKGNEPSSVEEFEAMFPGYHEYNPGTLISNDAESLETVGFNNWDNEWESGNFNGNTGEPNVNLDWSRSKNYIPIFPSTSYYFYFEGVNPANTYYVFYYDANKQFIFKSETMSASGALTSPANARYAKIQYKRAIATVVSYKVCINLSDPDKNGTYEPYWKRIQNLGLNSFKVKDSQGNVTTITGGLKSAGSVYDEIVGNKYIRYVSTRAYQSGDESNTSVTTDGHEYTNYSLTTPIEYDLVEPLIYTMKAGTTEARISPNEDGLSAPFCCDITYSANENNDAGNAQYAATAGRLLNTHKIWGQDFNGSEDVDGNLVANGTIQGTQLKSTVATGTAPLTVASTTMVQNLVAEKASKLLTARTIWGQSFDGSGDISGAISNITTLSASGLATIAGGIALGTSNAAQAAKMIWDETNNAWHLQGNLYADGSISAKGAINNNTDYVTQQQYNELISRIEALEG